MAWLSLSGTRDGEGVFIRMGLSVLLSYPPNRRWLGNTDGLGRRVLSIEASQGQINFPGNFPVPNFDPAWSDSGDFRIMGHQHNGAPLLTQVAKELQNSFAGVRIEIAGGFIG